jgi:branched-chain amino acid aminotransferase
MIIKGYQLTATTIAPLDMTASTLDEMTGELPEGFYTTFSTINGGTQVPGLQAHLDRLYIPAREMGLHPSLAEADLRKHLAKLVKAALPHESRVRLILTRDTGKVYAAIQPFVPPPKEVYENGVHVITVDLARHDPRIKGTDFITESAEQRKLVGGDVYEVLLTKNGRILEGMTSNFYAVKYVIASRQATRATQSGKQSSVSGGLLRVPSVERHPRNDILITARRGILLGVTRHAVLRLARGQGMSIEYRAPGIHENLDEAFLTSSSRGVVPIVMLNDSPVGEGRPGRWTKNISKAYQAYVEERSEKIAR